MENKKIKLTLSGIAKKSIENIELAKTQGKNSVLIEKKTNKFTNRGSFKRPSSVRTKSTSNTQEVLKPRPQPTSKPSTITND